MIHSDVYMGFVRTVLDNPLDMQTCSLFGDPTELTRANKKDEETMTLFTTEILI